MSELIASNTAALELAANSTVLSAEGVKNTNAMLGATELTETNSKTVYEIYLNTVAKDVDGFTAEQADDLFNVANQCPLVGGNAVFQARALYYLVDPEQEFDDPLLCLQQGLITKSMKVPTANAVSMVPNPADDDATLVLTTPLEEGGQLLMTNSMGSVVLSIRIPADQLRTAVHVNTLATGIYHYSVRTVSGELGQGKLNVAHTH